MSERTLSVLAVVLVALIAGLALLWHPEPESSEPLVNPLPAGGDFRLQSANGPVALADFRGRLSLVYFGYTYCPDICPTALSAIADGLAQLTPAERAGIAVIFVSVDPKRDTPDRLKDYVAFFAPEIVGVTGSAAEIAEIAKRYGVFYAEQPAEQAGGGYVVDHSSDTFIVGPDGKLLARMPHGTLPEQVAALIRQYLKPR